MLLWPLTSWLSDRRADSAAKGAPAAYRPTYPIAPPIDERHRQLLEAPSVEGGVSINPSIPGLLRREDAAKLYELAYFAGGDILEIGTKFGLSASVLGEAAAASHSGTVHTLEHNEERVLRARANLAAAGLTNVVVHQTEANPWLRRAAAERMTFALAFIDHEHDYKSVRSACGLIDPLLKPGSYVAIHDFIDRRNFKDSSKYGVPQGVRDGLSSRFRFVGGCGCIGIYRAA